VILNVNNTIPIRTNYSIDEGKLVIDLTNTDVSDGNKKVFIPVTCINGDKEFHDEVTVIELD